MPASLGESENADEIATSIKEPLCIERSAVHAEMKFYEPVEGFLHDGADVKTNDACSKNLQLDRDSVPGVHDRVGTMEG